MKLDKPQLQISLSREHQKYQSDVASVFKGFNTSFNSGLMRFSNMEMPMQIIIVIGTWTASNIAWDLLKSSIKHLYKKFKDARITLRDQDSIMYTIKPDSGVVILAVPEKISILKTIKNIDDLWVYFQSKWVEQTLGDVLKKIEGGGTPSKDRNDYWSGSIPWASVKDIVTHNPDDTQDHISEEGLRNSSSRVVSKGTLIIPTRMALGHAVFFDVDVAINQDLKALYPKDSLKNEFLFYWFQSRSSYIERLGSGSTVSGIQLNELKSLKFSLPPLPEQSRIVAVLETWDKAIEVLTKKIEVKREIKKGLMQELLTGKKRLPGFVGEWDTKKVGDCLLIKHGQSQKEVEVSGGIYPILGTGGEIGRASQFLYDKPSVLIGRKGTIDKPVYMDTPFWTVDTLFYSKVKDDHNAKFLYYCFLMINWKNYNEGSGIPSLSASTISSIKISIPKEKKEELAIATLLTHADDEIKAIEQSLSLLKDQKKYLLNNLITGTIRTPEKMKIT